MADAKRDGNSVPTLLAVSLSDGVTPVPLWADPVTHRLLVSDASGMSVFNIKAYGAVVDGVTDDTTAVNAAITAAVAAGGGIIFFPTGTTRCNSAINIPYTGTSFPTQVPLRFTGTTISWNGYWGVPPSGGSVLDMRYAGGDGTHVAKIDTRGVGWLEIDHLILKSGGSDNYQFMQTTNTTVFVHDNTIMGNSANSGVSCTQDFIKMGGSGTTIGTNASDAPFQGYGSKLHDNFYSKIQRAVIFGNDCNGIEVQNETISADCGSSLAQGAPYYFNPVSGHGCFGNRIIGGTVEAVSYPYMVTLLTQAQENTFSGMGYYDPTGPSLGMFYCDTGCGNNLIIVGYGLTSTPLLAGATATTQSVLDGRVGTSSQIPGITTGAITATGITVSANIASITLTGTQSTGKSFKWATQYNDATSISLVDVTASNAQRIIVDNTGRIGVGGTAPSEQFHVKSGSVAGIRIESTGASNLLDFYNGGDLNFSIRTNYNQTGIEFLRSTSGGGAPTTSMAIFDGNGNLGINQTLPKAKLDINGGVCFKRTTVADAAYPVVATDFIIAYTSLTASRTVTLPTAVGVTGQKYVIKDESGSAATWNIVIATTSAQTIDGGAASAKNITTNYGVLRLYSNGANWFTC